MAGTPPSPPPPVLEAMMKNVSGLSVTPTFLSRVRSVSVAAVYEQSGCVDAAKVVTVIRVLEV